MSLRCGGKRVSRFSFTDLASLPQEILDRVVDRVLVGDLRERHVLDALEGLAQVLDELPAAVGALHLPVGELVHLGEDLPLSSEMQVRVSSALQLSPSEKWNG